MNAAIDDPTYNDPRPIASITTEIGTYEVKKYPNVPSFHTPATKIEAYKEPGEMAYVTWFRVWWEDEITHRINGRYVIDVAYEVEL